MTAAETARIVERVLLDAGIVVHVTGIRSDTETARYSGGNVELHAPRTVDVEIRVSGFRPGKSWEEHLTAPGEIGDKREVR